jgi:excisionase family DNA binding protein
MAELLTQENDIRNRLAYRVSGVAHALDCTEHAARRMIERGLIPSWRLGRRVIVLADELEAYLKTLPQSNPEQTAMRAEASR